VAPGELGNHLYLSCLFARTMPLLRYEISDVSIPLPSPAPADCRSHDQGARRTDDTFWVYDAARNPVPCRHPFEAVFPRRARAMQYQLVQEERDLLRVVLPAKAGADVASVSAEIGTRLGAVPGAQGVEGLHAHRDHPGGPDSSATHLGKIRQIYSR